MGDRLGKLSAVVNLPALAGKGEVKKKLLQQWCSS